MDRGVLLVLLCLQAFLLITAFTSTDAAALVKDDQQQQSIDQVKRWTPQPPVRPKKKEYLPPGSLHGLVKRGTPQRTAREVKPTQTTNKGCADLPGGCGFLVKRFRLPKNPAEEVVLKKRQCDKLIGGCGFLVKRGTSQQTEAKEEEKKTAGKEKDKEIPIGSLIGLDQ